MKLAIQGALAGLGYAFAVTILSIWNMQLTLMFRIGMPPFTKGILEATVYTLLLGLPLGLLCSPLLRLRFGRFIHLLAMAVIWNVLEYVFALDSPIVKGFALIGGSLAFLLVLLSRWVARKQRFLPVTVGAILLVAAIVVPVIRYNVRTGLAAPAPSGATVAQPAAAGSPDVVLVVLDTVRAQNVSAYGYARNTTPTFDRLAAEGALFLDATAPSTWSLPSHASLFTGLFPSVHGCHGEHRYLRADLPALPEIMAQNGYETFCFTANPHISENFGLTRGFQYSDNAWKNAAGGRSFFFIFRLLDRLGLGLSDKGGGTVAGNFERFMEHRADDAPPAFVFINFLEAHFPYHQTPDEFLRKFTDLPKRKLQDHSLALLAAQFGGEATDLSASVEPAVAMYDSGVAYSDHLLSRVVHAISGRGRLDNTLLVVLADHGELLGEHGDFGHGISLYEEVLRVPFMIRYPAKVPAGTRVEAPVSTVGTLSTILELVNLPAPQRVSVGSLTPAFEGKPAGRPVIAEMFKHPEPNTRQAPLLRTDVRYRAYRVGTEKIISLSSGETFFFDLASDPGEERNLAGEKAERRRQLQQELEDWSAVAGLLPLNAEIEAGELPAVDPEAEERLKALGYIN